MNFNDLIDNYNILEDFHSDFETGKIKIINQAIHIYLPISDEKAIVSFNDLNLLSDYKNPKNKNIKYYPYFGIRYKNYYEFFVSIGNFRDECLDLSEFTGLDDKLKFKINHTTFYELSEISSLMKLLTKSIWFWEFPDEIDNRITLKMKINLPNDEKIHKNQLHKGLYYFNSFYFKPLKMYIKIKNYNYLNDIYEEYEEELNKFSSIKRKKTINKKDFFDIEPLKLYNVAQTLKDEQKFINLYRILEYYMASSILEKVRQYIKDEKIEFDNKEFYKIIKEINRERDQLISLLEIVLSKAKKTELLKYAVYKKLINQNRIKNLGKKLYDFRNSIVHAKKERDNIHIPDFFEDNLELKSWLYIVNEIAIQSIKKFNMI